MGASFAVTLAKGRALKFISHHDLARTFERMLRRSGLPYELTKGYHKRPRISFSPALPLGLTSNCEVAVISLREPLDPEEVKRRLSEQAPRGLKIVKVERDGDKWKWLFAQDLWAEYVLNVEFKGAPRMDPYKIASEIEGSAEVVVSSPKGEGVNIRPGIASLEVLSRDGRRARFRAVLQVVGKRTVGPFELLKAIEDLGGPTESAHICRIRFLRFPEVAERGDER